MTNYPAQIDTNISLPSAVDNLTPVQGVVVNRLRDAIIAIETELGIKPSGSYGGIATRFTTLEDIVGNLLIIELEKDLGGTLEQPLVVGLQGFPVSSATPTLNQVLTWDGIAWVGEATQIVFSNDLSGTNLAQTVVGLRNRPLLGTAPTTGQAIAWNGSAWAPASISGTFVPNGDLSGSSSSQTVIGLQNHPVKNTAPTDGQVLTWVNADGYWEPKNSAGGGFFYASVDIGNTSVVTSTAVVPTIYTVHGLTTNDHQLNLPAPGFGSPISGLSIIVTDTDGSIGKHQYEVNGNGANINGTGIFLMTAAHGPFCSFLFVYETGTLTGEWVIVASHTPNAHTPVTSASAGVTITDNGPNSTWTFAGLSDSAQSAILTKHPVVGETHTIMDIDKSLASFNYTIDGGGTILVEAPDGTTATTLVMTNSNVGAGGSITLMYVGSAGWRII